MEMLIMICNLISIMICKLKGSDPHLCLLLVELLLSLMSFHPRLSATTSNM